MQYDPVLTKYSLDFHFLNPQQSGVLFYFNAQTTPCISVAFTNKAINGSFLSPDCVDTL